MPSPFPGMNPYLEHADVWQDFHQSFIPLLRRLLAEQVRPKYLVLSISSSLTGCAVVRAYRWSIYPHVTIV
jgi:Protein of unknown function (DUF4058)